MRRIIRTLAALATLTLGVAGYLISTDHKTLASRCFYTSVALYSAAFLLWLIKSTRSWFGRRYVRLEQNAAPKLVKRFTVKWDEQSEPHCPVCGTELAPLYADPSTALPSRSHFKCISCNHIYCLTNEETGKPITLKEAKTILSSNELEVGNKPEPPKLQTSDAPQSSKAPEETKEPLIKELDRLTAFQTLAHLQLIHDILPEGEYVNEHWVEKFHETLRDIRDKLGRDMKLYFVKPSELEPLKTHIPATPRIGNRSGSPARIEYSKELYCKRDTLRYAINVAIVSLNGELLKARRLLSIAFEPNETEIAILKILAQVPGSLTVRTIMDTLNLSVARIGSGLDILVDYGHVAVQRDNLTEKSYYHLTDKGKQFLRDKNLI